ncbi:MAG: hypothetical protein J6J01_11995 [Oscillospiraceae bacterium]|nr:hypothetical protein [Oscillospiraceae bacterium]
MKKQRNCIFLVAMLALVMLFMSSCGSAADSSEAKGGFYNVSGVYYPEEFGAPVLGETVIDLDVSEATEEITTVGDALYYISNADLSGYLGDKCSLFVDLVIYDYDEVGTIRVSLNGWEESYTIVYVKDGENYYPFDPQYMEDSILLKTRKKCVAADDLDSLRARMVASFPREEGVYIDSEVKTLSNLTKEEYMLTKRITSYQYTEEQIKQWVEDGLTLDEWAEKITTPADAIQMLRAIDYHSFECTVGFYDETTGVDWASSYNAHIVFENRGGNCVGTSHIINYLLREDFDDQGYVVFDNPAGGHFFNYFKVNEVYIVCDFWGIPGVDFNTANISEFILYIGEDVYAFGDWYRLEGSFAEDFADPNSEDYLYRLFMYPREGYRIPMGFDSESVRTKFDCDILPEQYKDIITILYEHEGYPVRFRPIPDESTWPAEIR